jgi:hypothetical protein
MKNRLLLPFIILTAFFSAAGPLCAQLKSSALWQDVSEAQAAASTGTAQRGVARREIIPMKYRSLALQKTAMRQLLNRAPRESAGTLSKDGVEISLPLPDGGFGRFRIMESPVMEDGLAAKYPEIKTYMAQGIDDPSASGRIDMTPRGLRAMVLSAKGSFFVDPYWSNSDEVSIVYYKRDHLDREKMKNFACGVAGREASALNTASRPAAARPTGTNLRTYRLALATTGEYSVAVAGGSPSKANVLAAMVTSVNRVNVVYEREFAIRLIPYALLFAILMGFLSCSRLSRQEQLEQLPHVTRYCYNKRTNTYYKPKFGESCSTFQGGGLLVEKGIMNGSRLLPFRR